MGAGLSFGGGLRLLATIFAGVQPLPDGSLGPGPEAVGADNLFGEWVCGAPGFEHLLRAGFGSVVD